MEAAPSLVRLLSGIGKVSLVLAVVGVVGLGLDFVAGIPSLPNGILRVGGIFLLVSGLYLETRGIYVLWTYGGGTPNPADPPRRLVTEGPYRFSRNPLYLARLTMLSGASLYLGSPGILALTLGLFLGIQFFIIPGEERRLEERFGEEYVEYRFRVPRWVLLRSWPSDRRGDKDSIARRR